MRAWLLNKPAPVDTRPLTIAEVPVPVPGLDELLIRIDACGICRTDLQR